MNLIGSVKFFNKTAVAKAVKSAENVVLKEFNIAGNRLVSKQLETSKQVLKKLQAPYGSRSAEIVKIEKNFGQNQAEIISFRDKNNVLISRFRKELDKCKELWHSDIAFEIGKSSPKNKDYSLSVVDKQITKYNPLGEKIEYARYSTDYVQWVDGKKAVSQMKYTGKPLENGVLDEAFSITDKISGTSSSFINGTAKRAVNGEQISLAVKTSENIPAKLIDDPYLVMRTMPSELSVKYLKEIFSKQMKLNPNEINLFLIKGADKTVLSGIALADQKKLGVAVLNNLGENINTVSHELRHFKQVEYESKFLSLLKNKIHNPQSVNSREFKLAKTFAFRRIFTNPLWNRTSFIEKDAWKVGDRFQNDYKNKTVEFKNIFPYFSKNSVGLQ